MNERKIGPFYETLCVRIIYLYFTR